MASYRERERELNKANRLELKMIQRWQQASNLLDLINEDMRILRDMGYLPNYQTHRGKLDTIIRKLRVLWEL